MSETSLYAIVRNPDTKELRFVTRYIDNYIYPSEEELRKSRNYAWGLSGTYCSDLPYFNDPSKSIPQVRERTAAIAMGRAICELKKEYDVVAYSHRYGGWTTFKWEFNEDIHFDISTNFGYGSCSYFYMCVEYKGIRLMPYSKFIKYRSTNFSQIHRYTESYCLEYSEWEHVMRDALEFYNAVINKQENALFNWLKGHLDAMVSGVEKYLDADVCYFDNTSKRNILEGWNDIRHEIEVTGDDLWIAKSEKIAGSLEFIDNIEALPVQINPLGYVMRLEKVANAFLPKLNDKIEEVNLEIARLEREIAAEESKPYYVSYEKVSELLGEYSRNGKSWWVKKDDYQKKRYIIRLLNKNKLSWCDVRHHVKDLENLEEKRKLHYEREKFRDALVENKTKITEFFEDKATRDVLEEAS